MPVPSFRSYQELASQCLFSLKSKNCYMKIFLLYLLCSCCMIYAKKIYKNTKCRIEWGPWLKNFIDIQLCIDEVSVQVTCRKIFDVTEQSTNRISFTKVISFVALLYTTQYTGTRTWMYTSACNCKNPSGNVNNSAKYSF